MSQEQNSTISEGETSVNLLGLFAFKVGMGTHFNEAGEAVPVTVLKYEPWYVTQVKTQAIDGYDAVQISCRTKKKKNSSAAQIGHLKKSGRETGMAFSRELSLSGVSDLKVGAMVSIDSLKKGDVVKMTGVSKGHGFAGSVRRFNFAGGPASHGSKFHRRPGSSGNRTWPGRVMPGKRFPGHYGDEQVTVKNVSIVEVLPDQNVIMVKGPVPGARNSLVRLVKG